MPSPVDLPDAGTEPGSPALEVDSLPLSYQRSLMTFKGKHDFKFSLLCLFRILINFLDQTA